MPHVGAVDVAHPPKAQQADTVVQEAVDRASTASGNLCPLDGAGSFDDLAELGSPSSRVLPRASPPGPSTPPSTTPPRWWLATAPPSPSRPVFFYQQRQWVSPL
jgi:hypothetical protein